MAAAKLEYEIGADLSKFDLSITEVNKQIKRFTDLANTASKDGLAPLNAEIAKLIKYREQLKSIGLPDDLPDTAKRSRIALTDLSRVVQDLPFGFIGIQNNIPSLVQSFGSLTKQGGGLAGGLKLLGQSLIGPSGVFFAFSAVTSLITVAIQQYGSLGNAIAAIFGKVDSLSKITQDAAKSQKTYNESAKTSGQIIAEATGNVDAQITKVELLTEVISNLSNSEELRKNALYEIQKISKSYYGDITLAVEDVKKLTAATNKYTESLIANSIAEAYKGKLTEATLNLETQKNTLLELAKATELVNKKSIVASKGTYNAFAGLETTIKPGLIKSSTELLFEAQTKVVTEAINSVDKLKESYKKATLESLKFVEVPPDKLDQKSINEKLRKAKELADKLISIEKDKFDREDAAFKVSQDAFIATLNDKQKEEFNAIVDYENQRKTLLRANNFDLTAIDEALRIKQQEIANKYNDIALKAEETLKNERLRIQKEAGEAGRNQFESTFIKGKGISQEQKDAKALEQSYLNIGKTIFSNVINPLNQLFDIVLSKGEKSWEDFTASVVESLKKLYVKLAAAAAIAAILSLATGGTAGGGVSFIKAFTSILGVGLGKGGVANPSFGGVQPAGMAMNGNVNLVLRGQDLVGSLNRTNSQLSRIG